jgi:hypothetical protein
MIGMKAVPVPIDSLVARKIGDETILVNESGDTLHTLNETGSFVWSLIDGRRSLGEILSFMDEEYDLPADAAEKEVADFVQELVQRGLVRVAE